MSSNNNPQQQTIGAFASGKEPVRDKRSEASKRDTDDDTSQTDTPKFEPDDIDFESLKSCVNPRTNNTPVERATQQEEPTNQQPAVVYCISDNENRLVEIYANPDRVVVEGTEANKTPLDAVRTAESKDNLTIIEGDPFSVPDYDSAEIDTESQDTNGDSNQSQANEDEINGAEKKQSGEDNSNVDEPGLSQEEALDLMAYQGEWNPEVISAGFNVQKTQSTAIEQMGNDASGVLKVNKNLDELTDFPGIGEETARSIGLTIPKLQQRNVSRYSLPLQQSKAEGDDDDTEDTDEASVETDNCTETPVNVPNELGSRSIRLDPMNWGHIINALEEASVLAEDEYPIIKPLAKIRVQDGYIRNLDDGLDWNLVVGMLNFVAEEQPEQSQSEVFKQIADEITRQIVEQREKENTVERFGDDQHMREAYYWGAQIDGWVLDGPNSEFGGEYYVDIKAGKPILVLSDYFNEGNAKCFKDALRDVDFPPMSISYMDEITDKDGKPENWRIFFDVTDMELEDRLTMRYWNDWENWTPHKGFAETKINKFA